MKIMKNTIFLFLLSLTFVTLVDLFTVSPHVTSGNGNLGLLLVIPASLIFVLFAKSLWVKLGSRKLTRGLRLAALVILLNMAFLEYQFVLHLIKDLGGPSTVEASRIYRYPLLNQYTNTMFINVYTLGMVASTTLFIRSFFIKKGDIS